MFLIKLKIANPGLSDPKHFLDQVPRKRSQGVEILGLVLGGQSSKILQSKCLFPFFSVGQCLRDDSVGARGMKGRKQILRVSYFQPHLISYYCAKMAGSFGSLETWASNSVVTEEDKKKFRFVNLILLPSFQFLQRIIYRNKYQKFVSKLPLERERCELNSRWNCVIL